MKRAELLRLDPIPAEKKKGYYAASMLQTAGGKDYLEIDFFNGQQRLFRYFADVDKGERSTWYEKERKWYSTKLENAVADATGGLRSSYWIGATKYKWVDDRDRKRALDYLNAFSIDWWEGDCDLKKRRTAAERKAERIERDVGSFPLIPDSVEDWVNEKVLTEHFTFLNDEDDGSQTFFCTACRGSGTAPIRMKLNRENTCPICGKKVRGRMKGQTVERHETVIVFQTNEDHTEYCEKQFTALKIYDNEGEKLSMGASIIAIMRKGKNVGRDVYYGQDIGADELSQSWWTKMIRSPNFRAGYVYPYNMDDILPMIGAEHSGIEILIAHGKTNINHWLIYGLCRNTTLEYLIKRGLYRLTNEIIDAGGYEGERDLILSLRNDKESAKRLKRINGGLIALKWIKRTTALSDDDIAYLEKKLIWPESEGVREALKHSSEKKVVNYMRKNCGNGQFRVWWQDYLNMAAREGQNLNDPIVLFPRDLKERHDEAVRIIQEQQDAKRAAEYRDKDIKIREHLPETEIYRWTAEGYTVIPAVCCEDLMRESRKLHHCVGTSSTYMDRMVSGISWILFLRRESDPDTPYYTIEINMDTDRILQWYSEYDRKPDESVIRGVLKNFSNDIKKRRKAARKEAAAE